MTASRSHSRHSVTQPFWSFDTCSIDRQGTRYSGLWIPGCGESVQYVANVVGWEHSTWNTRGSAGQGGRCAHSDNAAHDQEQGGDQGSRRTFLIGRSPGLLEGDYSVPMRFPVPSGRSISGSPCWSMAITADRPGGCLHGSSLVDGRPTVELVSARPVGPSSLGPRLGARASSQRRRRSVRSLSMISIGTIANGAPPWSDGVRQAFPRCPTKPKLSNCAQHHVNLTF